jgi:oligopeptide/dipeptide ABC transporter ATP-binding protein
MPDGATPAAAVLEVRDLAKRFTLARDGLFGPRPAVRAVDGVSFAIAAGETLGLVGESGCGKSTVGRMIMRLIEPSAGRIVLEGEDITTVSRAAMRARRRSLQMVFQDPYASLNPRMTAGAIVGEPLLVHGLARGADLRAQVAALFARVGLRADQMGNTPSQFSGGQRQRLSIARALALAPKLIVADEPVSALDVSIQAQVVNLLADLQDERKLAYLFIAHDLAVVRTISHRVAVMYLGRIVELAAAEALFEAPRHPYTQALLAAVPRLDPQRRRRAPRDDKQPQGELPSPLDPPTGCHFHPRCPQATARCRVETPALRTLADGRLAACHLLD